MPTFPLYNYQYDIPFCSSMLISFARALPCNSDYEELAKEIIKMEIPSLTSTILRKRIIMTDRLDRLWKYGSTEMRRQIASDEQFIRNISE